jgi:hypothetical protein
VHFKNENSFFCFKKSGANPTIASYNSSPVRIYISAFAIHTFSSAFRNHCNFYSAGVVVVNSAVLGLAFGWSSSKIFSDILKISQELKPLFLQNVIVVFVLNFFARSLKFNFFVEFQFPIVSKP